MDSVQRNYDCDVMSAWEERIWLDRRETVCPARQSSTGHGVLARIKERISNFRSRMQLGPVAGDDWMDGDGWSGGDAGKRF